MDRSIPPCPECGEHFENVFQATDHLLEDDDEFDPALVLPNGARLMIGSLLRCLYKYADKPDQIKKLSIWFIRDLQIIINKVLMHIYMLKIVYS